MELYRLKEILDLTGVKIVDSSVAVHTEIEGMSVLHHLYDCDALKKIQTSKLEAGLMELEVSNNFFQTSDTFFTPGVVAESYFFLKCVEGHIKFLRPGHMAGNEEDDYRMELLNAIHDTLYSIVRHMKMRNVCSKFNGDCRQFLKLRNYLSKLSEENGLKMKRGYNDDAPKSKNVRDMRTDEEIIAAGLMLGREKNKPVSILTGDWDLDKIARYILDNFEELDLSLVRSIKSDIAIYHPDKVVKFFFKTLKIPAYFS